MAFCGDRGSRRGGSLGREIVATICRYNDKTAPSLPRSLFDPFQTLVGVLNEVEIECSWRGFASKALQHEGQSPHFLQSLASITPPISSSVILDHWSYLTAPPISSPILMSDGRTCVSSRVGLPLDFATPKWFVPRRKKRERERREIPRMEKRKACVSWFKRGFPVWYDEINFDNAHISVLFELMVFLGRGS